MREQAIRIERHSSAGPEVVYRLLTDIAGWPRWAPRIVHGATVSTFGNSEPGAVGTIRHIGGVDEEIVDAQPPHLQRYTINRGLPVSNYDGCVRISPDGAGSHVSWTARFTGRFPLIGPAVRLLCHLSISALASALVKAADEEAIIEPPISDPAVPDIDTFAERFITAIESSNLDAIRTLFADDATLLHPFGRVEGIADIERFYTNLFSQAPVSARVGSVIVSGTSVVFEICSADAPDDAGPMAIDHATLDDNGRIRRLIAAYRPGGPVSGHQLPGDGR
ncbi:SRPBCC family protein [Nocardia sp. BSTN01]|uniref:SRPBCC family protein n=1 Tax=Nocardia sp. BSTN01 TaxID=2783665 RepID=UPI00188E495F|nr:SRPBCC family protein [Nocardia sp. BSTN01]MBF4997256.1 SRPBCC family protein [Nocardia sp. BSTN01]